MRDIPIPSDWNEETDGWQTVLVCIPNSVQWASVILGAIQALHYGPLWERETGNIKDTQEIIDQIVEGIIMNCNEVFDNQAAFLERIAIALERIDVNYDEYIDSQFISVSEFVPILQILGLSKYLPIIDVLGETVELFERIPDFSVRMPLAEVAGVIFGTMTKIDYMTKLDQIAAQLQNLSIATAGPSATAVTALVSTLVPEYSIRDAVLGPINEFISAVGPAGIAALTGNYMTNKVDDLRNATNGGSVLPADNVVAQLKAIKAEIEALGLTVTVGAPGGVDGCGCITIGPEEAEPGEGEPEGGHTGTPPDGFDDWDAFDQYKCRYANKLADEFIYMVNQVALIAPVTAGFTVAAIITAIVAALTGAAALVIIAWALLIGAAAITVYAAFAQILFRYTTDGPVFLSNWAQAMEESKGDVVCALFLSQTPEAARQALEDWARDRAEFAAGPLDEETGLLEQAENIITGMINNNLVNMMFPDLANAEALPIDYIGDIDCQTCQPSGCEWELVNGSGSFNYLGTEFTLSSEDIGGGVHYMFAQTVVACTLINYCTEFTARSAMNDGAANYTRELYSSANTVHSYNQEQFDYNHVPATAFWNLDQQYPISAFIIASDSAFTVTLRLVQQVEATDFDPSASPACD